MKSMMKKTTIREIKHSFGRYFAILAIVALGVGFFTGLKVTKKAMTISADRYLTDGQLYDFRLLSTLGFEASDVDTLMEKEDVRSVEGAVFADIIYVDANHNDTVIKAHSLTEDINQVILTAGRMPKEPDECVVDALVFTEDAIGTTLQLSENNSDDDLDKFSYKEYTITGIVKSPSYIQFERGNTSIGNGKINGFMYLKREGFSMDIDTEIYVKFDKDYRIYSEEYEDYVEQKKALWETYCEEQGERRYQSIVSDAKKEYNDKLTEFEDEKAKGQQELDDALKEIEDARFEILDGEKQIADAYKEISDNEKVLNAKEKELDAARKELDANKEMLCMLPYIPEEVTMQLNATQKQIDEGQIAIEDGKKQIRDAKASLADKTKELEEAKSKLEEGEQEYADGLQEFEEQIADAEAKLKDAWEEINHISKPDTYVLGRDTNIGYVCFENDANIVNGIANVFPVFFFLVAALVCMTTMNRMVDEQRTQIGILKALGYNEFKIMSKYLFYSGSAAVLGSVMGYFLGTKFFPMLIWNTYKLMYMMGGLDYVFDLPLAIISLTVALLCSMGTTYFSCRYVLREVTAELLRPKAPKAGKRVFLEYIPFVWNKLKFLQKVSVRNIVRYKKRFFMMILGISGCTALLVTGFGIKDSIADVVSQQYKEIETYDINITLKENMTIMEEDDRQAIQDIFEEYNGSYMLLQLSAMDFVSDEGIKSVSMVVPKDTSEVGAFIDLHTVKGEKITYPKEGEAVISKKLADNFHVSNGDIIVLRSDSMKEMEVKVLGICENYIYNYVYIHPDTYAKYIEEPCYKAVYAKASETESIHEFGAALMGTKEVTGVTIIQDMMERFSSMMESLNYIVIVVLICAAALAFIVLYNLNNINITERVREIATIKVLGFYKNETASYVFRENIVLTAFGCGLGLILGKLLHAFVMNEIRIDVVSFDIHINGISYLFSVALTFVFTIVVNWLMGGKLENINMAESLKSVD